MATSFEEARDIILRNIAPTETEQVQLLDSLGRVTAKAIVAPLNLPCFDNSPWMATPCALQIATGSRL
jgi:molybdopterin molybdotransferase